MAEVGDKYIIEIGEVYETLENSATANNEQVNKPTFLYRIKGFNSLVFDEDGLNKLEEYEKQEKYDAEAEYQRGLNDAWACARKIFGVKYGYTHDEIIGIYGRRLDAIDLPPSEAIAKIKAYEEQKKVNEEKIKVGDEIVFGSAHVVVTYINSYNEWNGFAINDCGVCKPGQGYTCMQGFDGWKKTGRHFQQIAEVLKQLQEGEG